MRELAVFYCPKCGHYAYYQTSRHPQCPKCGTWVNNKNRKGRGHDVFLPPGSDQTVLF